jgi:DNA-binding NtrC family response regulator
MRRAPRLPVDVPVTITGWGFSGQGRLTELSLTGGVADLTAPDCLSPLTWRFHLTPLDRAFQVLGRVVRWNSQGVAAEFLDLDAAAQSRLWENLAPRLPRQAETCAFCNFRSSLSEFSICHRCRRNLNFQSAGFEEVLKRAAAPGPAGLLGFSPVMRQVFEQAALAARHGGPVILSGPHGAGKEALARAIHELSRRRERPFVPVNCRGVPPEWQSSALFRAGGQKMQSSREADEAGDPLQAVQGGTLYLAEVADLTLELQSGLLDFMRRLQEPQGWDNSSWAPECRVIVGSPQPLWDLTALGRFQKELYRQLAGQEIDIPPLKDRGEDLLILAAYYLKQFAARLNRDLWGFSGDTALVLVAYDWPGNLDELLNRVQRATVLAEGPWVAASDLGLRLEELPGRGLWSPGMSLEEALLRFEERLLAQTLERFQGNIQLAAEALQISTAALQLMLAKYELVSGIPAPAVKMMVAGVK